MNKKQLENIFTQHNLRHLISKDLLDDICKYIEDSTPPSDPTRGELAVSPLPPEQQTMTLDYIDDEDSTLSLIDAQSSLSIQKHQAPAITLDLGDYDDLGVLGVGGMGEVRKIRDPKLHRTLAMKIIHPHLLSNAQSKARFIEEGQICAQLQHPNIVPVHEIGELDDGRIYFTMKEIKGKTLRKAICEVHEIENYTQGKISISGWSFRKLIDAFYQACQAISYAHSKGVLHRDLKSSNIMLGEYGEILVVDWGIAKILGTKTEQIEAIKTDRFTTDTFLTRLGQITGTPAYMPPEQAEGKINELDVRSDIYSLGAILYEILTGNPPYVGGDNSSILERVLSGPPVKITKTGSSQGIKPIENHDELIEACEQALKRDKSDRYSSVNELANIISNWLEGSKKREQALQIVQEALSLQQTRLHMREEANQLQAQAEEGLKNIPIWKGEETKGEWWKLEQRAQHLKQKADLMDIIIEQKLQGALTHKADIEEAHLELASYYHQKHQALEKNRNTIEANKTRLKLEEHVSLLPDQQIKKHTYLNYLKGTGSLSLVCDTQGAEIILEKYVPHHKRLIAKPIANLGKESIENYPLEMGSYRVRLRKKGHLEVLYPISISRGEHWSCLDPFGVIKPIHIPKQEALKKNECFVPGGWFWAGGDPMAEKFLPQKRIWVDDFVVRKFPITNREYIAFLNDLIHQGREEEALQYTVRERAGQAGELGAMIYGRKKDGSFILVPDADGDLWHPDWPVNMVDWYGAMAYASWESARIKRPYRLLHELEREKCARGVDGRLLPWGDHFDPSYACMHQSHSGYSLPSVIESFPIDQSVYGVRGVLGNMRDWCLNSFAETWGQIPGLRELDGTHLIYETLKQLIPSEVPKSSSRTFRGGYWGTSHTRTTSRFTSIVGGRYTFLGFRLGYSL